MRTKPATRPSLRTFAIALLVASLWGCAHSTRVPIYVSMPEQGGLVRKQADEIIPYAKTRGFFCTTPQGMEVIIIESQKHEELSQ